MEPSSVPVRRSDAVEAEVDGQRVIMSPEDFSYFGMTGTGAVVWDRLDGVTAVEDLSVALAAEFATDVDQVRREVLEFVDALEAAGLASEASGH
jgi:hypothetical protein